MRFATSNAPFDSETENCGAPAAATRVVALADFAGLVGSTSLVFTTAAVAVTVGALGAATSTSTSNDGAGDKRLVTEMPFGLVHVTS